jgi:Holliday junction resolvasome RuvABC ATP-dependent DNA helicase subunit
MTERLVSPQMSEEEQIIEGSLRPRRLAEYIGQDKIKQNLSRPHAAGMSQSIMCCCMDHQG